MAMTVGLALFMVAAIGLFGPVSAQQLTGTLGSPSATTMIGGTQLPPPDAKFGGGHQGAGFGVHALVAAARRAAKARAERAADHDRR